MTSWWFVTQQQSVILIVLGFLCFDFAPSRFYQNLQSALTTEKLQLQDPPDTQEPQHTIGQQGTTKEELSKTGVYKRRRRRDHPQADCCEGDGDSDVQELYGPLDLLILGGGDGGTSSPPVWRLWILKSSSVVFEYKLLQSRTTY